LKSGSGLAVCKDAFDEREQLSGSMQQDKCTVTVLDIGGMNEDIQQETQRVDQVCRLRPLTFLPAS